MPFKNYISARLETPEKYEEIRWSKKKFKENYIEPVFGITSTEKTEIQALRFHKDHFDVSKVKKWLKDHNYKYISIKENIMSKRGTIGWKIFKDIYNEDYVELQKDFKTAVDSEIHKEIENQKQNIIKNINGITEDVIEEKAINVDMKNIKEIDDAKQWLKDQKIKYSEDNKMIKINNISDEDFKDFKEYFVK